MEGLFRFFEHFAATYGPAFGIVFLIFAMFIFGIFFTIKTFPDLIREYIQKKISEISSDFVSVAINNLDDKIDDMLRKSGKYFGVDRAYLFRFSEDMSMAEYTNEWCDDDIKPAIDIIGAQLTSSIPWWMKELEQNLSNIKFFCRCHSAYIVNLRNIKKFTDKYIIMNNDAQISVSKKYHAKLIRKLALIF